MTVPSITPATGVPKSSVDAVPPIGSRGLPFTWAFADWPSDVAPYQTGSISTDNTHLALLDPDIWTDRQMNVAGVSGTAIQSEPTSPTTGHMSAEYIQLNNMPRVRNQMMSGANVNTSPPSLNHTRGSLVFSSTGLGISKSIHDVSKVKGSAQFQTLSFSNCGRFVDHPEENYASARPANHSWNKMSEGQQFVLPKNATDLGQGNRFKGTNLETDSAIGGVGDGSGDCSDPMYQGGDVITSTVVRSASAIPSNGLGSIYGDSHNSIHYTNVVCTSLASDLGNLITQMNGGVDVAIIEEYTRQTHWCLNMGTTQVALQNGVEASSPDGLTKASAWTPEVLTVSSLWDTNTATSSMSHANPAATLTKTETVQQIMTHDTLATGAGGTTDLPFSTLGDITLGASVVHDTAGLIGFEGTITATAFYAPTKETDPAGVQTTISNPAGSNFGYAGLNIQVHSGFGIRRNKGNMGYYGNPYRYGSDGTPVRVMTDAMKTYAQRGAGAGTADQNCNKTWFRTGTVGHNNSQEPSSGLDGIPAIGDITAKPAAQSVFAHAPLAQGQTPENCGAGDTAKVIGANIPNNQMNNEIHNSYSTGRWIADGVPTKVQIIPVITGYEDVQVQGGGFKQGLFPSATDQTFRKPLVDYHILVSITEPSATRANTDPANPFDGDPTQRNIPDPQRLSANADYSKQGCVIYHGIFRIDPQTLEQIFIDTTDASAGLYAMDADSGAICPSSVIPRHDYSNQPTGVVQQGWGLHQATPFRPIALSDALGKVARLCGAVEGGGFYQRGGISHLWDGCEYGGEIFVGADCIKPHELQTSAANGTNEFSQPTFGIFGNGQIWADGTGTPKRPDGVELFIWRYSPQNDPLYPSFAQGASAMQDQFGIQAKHGSAYLPTDDDLRHIPASWQKSRTGNLEGAVWAIHDWVLPQVELMRYLGREEKHEARHFETSGSRTWHPTLHCSSLRCMDDGRFMMAAVHVDYIKTEADYPTNEIRYPLNPDLDVATCPAGYYYSGGKCIPLVGAGDSPAGFQPDPQSGDDVPVADGGTPTPVNGTGSSTPNKQDNFSLHPTWSKLKANTSARSLIMMFSDVKADASTGYAKRGKSLFDIDWDKVAVGDGTTQTIATQTWTDTDTWWSGSRISYWYQESGQRAIPISYGSYPDLRMTHANLPRSLPFLVNEFPLSMPVSSKARIASGFPMIQPAIVAKNLKISTPSVFQNNDRQLPTETVWTLKREKHLKLTRFVPTTIGFADFGAGASPYQEYGWSGWSFPRGLYDPMGYGDNTVFFSDSPEAEAEPMGTAVVPTEQAIFAGMGQTAPDNDDSSMVNPLSPLLGYTLDLTSLTFPTVLESIIIYKTGTGQEKLLVATTCGSVAEVLATMLDPALSTYHAIDQEYVLTGQPPLAQIDPSIHSAGLVRTMDSTHLPMNEIMGIMNFDFIICSGVKYYFKKYGIQGHRMLRGGVGGWSHHGGLHYGISTKLHPYRVDRVMKQVHGGVGYDLPLHLLKPPKAHVRARAGARNSIELELETPFHRTDNIHLLGATNFNAGFNLGGESPPNAPRPVMGQFYLRTNLWDKPLYGEGGTDAPLVAPLSELNSRVHGPIISGSQALEAFWSDHPTDHFHASAMPILPNTDYDLAMIETSNYSPLMLARSSEINNLDVLALGEQLESSVDVHISKTAKPYWDSGAIVSAQGEGYRGNKASHMIHTSAMMDGHAINGGNITCEYYALGTLDMSMGMGQRSVRTPDGTLHQFHIRRSAQAGSDNLPIWTHYKKPLYGDVFWNSKATKPDPASAIHDGFDEVGPLLNSIGASGDGTSASLGKVMGATFCSDSNGTIHAVIEYHASTTAGHKAHRLYYHYAERQTIGYNPEPVYDWNWQLATPVLIQNAVISEMMGGSMYDLRQPSMVCDSAGRLHLVCTQIYNSHSTASVSRILYTCKLADESSFPEFLPTTDGIEGLPATKRWQAVHNIITDGTDTDGNLYTNTFHYTTSNQEPKVCLRGNDIPVVFYRGTPIYTFTFANRKYDAIYCNMGGSPTGSNDPSGVFVFDSSKSIHVVGLRPDSKNAIEDFDVQYYDAIIDERDMAYVVSTKDDYDNTDSHAPRQTLMTFFDTQKSLADQYNDTDGLGTHLTIWQGKNYTGAGDPKVDNNYRDLTLTTNGKGEIHLIMTFCMIGDNDNRFGETYRDSAGVRQSALAPLQWSATPAPSINVSPQEPYVGGFIKPTISPNWSGQVVPPMPPYKATSPDRREHNHIMHIWIPSIEFSDDNHVLRSMNIRWLSVPSIRWDNTAQSWTPVGSAQTMAGEEDFPHHSPQIRYQRFWGYDASELDLRWHTNELSWYRTNTGGSNVYYPSAGGVQMQIGTGEQSGQGVAGFPNGL